MMTKHTALPVQSAIDLLKSGGSIENIVISDLAESKVNVMDAFLLAKNGCLVPDGNIVYDDDQIQYDPDFDGVDWGKPVPFKKLKASLALGTAEQSPESTEFVVKLQLQSPDMKQWLIQHKAQLHLIISGLVENMYKADKLAKS